MTDCLYQLKFYSHDVNSTLHHCTLSNKLMITGYNVKCVMSRTLIGIDSQSFQILLVLVCDNFMTRVDPNQSSLLLPKIGSKSLYNSTWSRAKFHQK